MTDDIQKETERIHQGIVESLSFSEALAKRDAEIERLRKEKADILVAKEIVFAPPAIPESFVIQETQKVNVALHADITRLQNALATADEMRRAGEAEIERLREALEFVLEAAQWHFDGNADPKNESPEDMTAHINGLIVRRVREALGE